jgi:transcriptional regulator with XRE-family HTH domain
MQQYDAVMLDDPLDPQPTFGWAVRFGRQMTNRSVREVAAQSGLSAGQISRLANEHSSRPSFDTVVRLAPALGIHPACLHVLAGHISGEDARTALGGLVDAAAHEIEREYDAAYRDQLHARLDVANEDHEVRTLAVELVTLPVHGVDYPTLPALSAADAPDADLLDEIIRAWPQLTPERRWRLVEITRDLRDCSARYRRSLMSVEESA